MCRDLNRRLHHLLYVNNNNGSITSMKGSREKISQYHGAIFFTFMILVRIDLVLDACDCDDCACEVGQLGVELVCRKKMKASTESECMLLQPLTRR
jgi:hypothetical protein